MTHEGAQAIDVAMPHFAFMESIVSWLINGENISYVVKLCCLLHFTVLWARVRISHLCPSFARNPMMPLCFINFHFCFTIHAMDCIELCHCVIHHLP